MNNQPSYLENPTTTLEGKLAPLPSALIFGDLKRKREVRVNYSSPQKEPPTRLGGSAVRMARSKERTGVQIPSAEFREVQKKMRGEIYGAAPSCIGSR